MNHTSPHPLPSPRPATACRVVAAAIAALSIATAAPAQFFAGAGATYSETTFRPEYDYTYDRPDSSYENVAYGTDVELTGGYRVQAGPHASLGLAGNLGLGTARWSMRSETGGYHLDYRLPARAFVSLQPAWHPAPRLRVFGELGAGAGCVELVKEADADATSRYDETRWLAGVRFGGGVAYTFADGWEIAAWYLRTAYESFRYDSHLADGTVWERIRDKPYANGFTIGLTRLW